MDIEQCERVGWHRTCSLQGLYVKGLHEDITDEDLRKLFEPFGHVLSASAPSDASCFTALAWLFEACTCVESICPPAELRREVPWLWFRELRLTRGSYEGLGGERGWGHTRQHGNMHDSLL